MSSAKPWSPALSIPTLLTEGAHEPANSRVPSWGICLYISRLCVPGVHVPRSQAAGRWCDYFFTIWMTSSCSMVWVRPTRCGLYLVLVP